MNQSSKNFDSSSRFLGGIAIGYTALTEVDFTATAGAAYNPPETGDFRRINVTRCLQLVSDASSIIETFQTSAAEVRLPASTLTEATNDAGSGRLLIQKNSGVGTITIKDYLGTTITTILAGGVSFLTCDDNNNWDYYFRANQVPHELITNMEASINTQTALEYLMKIFRDVMKDPTGFVNKYIDSKVTLTNATREFKIEPLTPTYTSYDYYIAGKIYTVSTIHTVTITDDEGMWYFFFNYAGTLVANQTHWEYNTPIAPIFSAYWDSVNKLFIRLNEERHGTSMDHDTHRYLHRTQGPLIDTMTIPLGLTIGNYTILGDGSLNSHAQYSVSDGTYFDEDLALDIKNAITPVNPFEQRLSPIAYVPVFFLQNGANWRKKNATQFPFYENPPALPYYNLNTAGVWSLAPVTNTYFFATFLIYTDDPLEPVMTILGQRQDTNLIEAVNNNTRANLILPKRFTEEMYFSKKIIWEVNTAFTNTPKARMIYVALSTEVNPANDRYFAVANYNGNAGTGKYLDFYAGQSSDTSPLPLPEPTFIKSVMLSAIAASTGTVTIYKNLTTVVLTISLSAATYTRLNFAILLAPDDKLTAQVTSGSFNKPAVTIFFQTNL